MNQEEIKMKCEEFMAVNEHAKIVLVNGAEFVALIKQIDGDNVTFIPSSISDKFPENKTKLSYIFGSIKSIQVFPSSEWVTSYILAHP